MAIFKYKAISKEGTAVSGVVDASSEFEAIGKIKLDCNVVTKIKSIPVKRERIDLNEPLWISEQVLILVSSQFSILLRNSLPTVRAVELIAAQTTDRLMKKILRRVAVDVAAGYGLAQSFERRGKKLPLTFIETVRAGEESGTLEHSFAKLKTYFEKSYQMKSKVRAAMQYPVLLLVLSMVVISIVVTVSMPTMTEIILNAGNELPLPTIILIKMTRFLERWWGAVSAVVVALIVFARIYSKTEKGRFFFATIALKIPIIGKINAMKGAAQFSNTMATLLEAGMPTTRAVFITGKVMDNYAMGRSASFAAVGLAEGKRMGDVFKGNPYFPALLLEMTAVGEESGALEDALTTIGTYYENEVEAASNWALSLLEPTITVIMGILIGSIVLALYLPMFDMYNSIGV